MIGRTLRMYPRSACLALVLFLIALQEWYGIRAAIHYDLYDFSRWLRFESFIGELGKEHGALFATIEAIHLLSMAVLGGCLFLLNMRLLGWIMDDTSLEVLASQCLPVIDRAIVVSLVTGALFACTVADKLYGMTIFWIKMGVFCAACAFHYLAQKPLLNRLSCDAISPRLRRVMASASLAAWFTVAATGRWIGFS